MVDDPGSRPPELLPASNSGAPATDPEDRPLDPEKLLRLAGLVRAVLDEVRQLGPDQATATELSRLYGRVTTQVADALPNALRDELAAIDLAPDEAPAEAAGQEVRFAYAGLIGWLSGLFQGLQAAMQFQQLQAMNALPGGSPAGGVPDGLGGRGMDLEPGTGHYL